MAKTPSQGMFAAITAGNADEVRRIIAEHPEEVFGAGIGGSWLHYAARKGMNSVISVLNAAGLDLSFRHDSGDGSPLGSAVAAGQVETARHLIALGADVNLERELIAAINSGSRSFELVSLLVESGSDVNRWWYFGDPKKGVIHNALSWALANGREDIADYLRVRGAVMPPTEESRGESFLASAWHAVFGAKESKEPVEGIEEEVIAYFEKQLGPVRPLSVGHTVTSGWPIRVHVVPASKERNHITLFTTGMSRKPMKVPSIAEKDFAFAELFIQLPGNWPYQDIANFDHAWPVHWLRMIAAYPHEQGTWLPPATVIANDPPEPIASNTRFTSMLLLAEMMMTSKAGCRVQLYRLTPLYPEERQMEMEQGIDGLMRAFDKYDVPFVVNLNRRNVAKP